MLETTHTYALLYDGPEGPIPFYVGEAIDPAARFKQHVRDAANPLSAKEAYEFLRSHSIRDFYYEVLDGVTEAEAVRELTLAGFTIYNANRGIRSTTKKKRDDTFARLNRQAEERIERAERRTILHGKGQQLTKSQVVAARIRGELPTVEQLSSCEWHATAPQMIGGTAANSADHCEFTRIGDISIYVATRGKKDITAQARHRDGRVCSLPSHVWWRCPRDRLLNILVEEMHGEYGWQRPYETT